MSKEIPPKNTTAADLEQMLKDIETQRKHAEGPELQKLEENLKKIEAALNALNTGSKENDEITKLKERAAQIEEAIRNEQLKTLGETNPSLLKRLRDTNATEEQMKQLGLSTAEIAEVLEGKEKGEKKDDKKDEEAEKKKEERRKEKEDQKNKNNEKIEEVKKEAEEALEKEAKEKALDERLKQIGLSEQDFKNMPGWNDLSYGQKMLVLEQAAQDTLSNVRKIGKERFEKDNKISTKLKDFNPVSFLKKTRNNFFKGYFIDKEEKKAILEAAQGKIVPTQEKLTQLVERTADMNLPVTEKGGKAVIEFATVNPDATDEQKELIKNYNEIANEFAHMPDSWKNEKAAKSTDQFAGNNYAKYQEAKARYEHARAGLVDAQVALNRSNGQTLDQAKMSAMDEAKNMDYQIAMLQFTNTHPDAIGELKRIHDSSSFSKIFKDNETVFRGVYMGSGAVARGVAATTLGAMTGPLVASIIGGLRARAKANKKINEAFMEGREMGTRQERKEAGKQGLYDDKNANMKGLAASIMPGVAGVNAKEVGGFVDADSQIQRLTNLMGKLENTSLSVKDRADIISQLQTRIDYIEDKHTQGLLNYGEKNPVGLNYQLLNLMSTASVRAAEGNPYFAEGLDLKTITNAKIIDNLDPEFLDGLVDIQQFQETQARRQALLGRVTDYNEAQQKFEQTYYKNTETAKGAVIGATFAVLGWKIRDWMHGHPTAPVGLESRETTGVIIPKTEETIKVPEQPETTVPEKVTHVPHPPKPHVEHPEPTQPEEPETKTPEPETPEPEPTKVPDKEVEVTTPKSSRPDYSSGKIRPLKREYVHNEESDYVVNPTGSLTKGVVEEDGVVDNGFTRSVPLTEEAKVEEALGRRPELSSSSVIKNGRIVRTYESSIPSQRGVKIDGAVRTEAIDLKNEANEFNSLKEVKRAYGGRNIVAVEKAETPEINEDVTYEEFDKKTEELFKENGIDKLPADEVRREAELQQLFGESKKEIEFVAADNRNEEVLEMEYFRDNEEAWETANKLPAKDFLDFNKAELMDGSAVPEADMKILVDNGIVIDHSETDEATGVINHDYTFKGEGKLNRLMKAYKEYIEYETKRLNPGASRATIQELVEMNSKPFDDETIEDYVGRITKDIHQTNDGTFYALRDADDMRERTKVTVWSNQPSSPRIRTRFPFSRILQRSLNTPRYVSGLGNTFTSKITRWTH